MQRLGHSRSAVAVFALCTVLAAPSLAAASWAAMDPVFVFYPQDFCSGERIGLEVWNRDERRWTTHPTHPVVPVDSCQLEDAGVLFNEIRWRCLGEERGDSPSPWNVGVRVFEAAIMGRCGVARSGSGFGETAIHVSAPKPGETISDADPRVAIEGSVWVGGLAGAEYDVVIAIDTSATDAVEVDVSSATSVPIETVAAQLPPVDPLAAQVNAARSFVDAIGERLGEVRVAIVSFPGLEPGTADRENLAAPSDEPAAPLARRELALTDDARAIERALARIVNRGRAGPMSFSDGLALGVRELFRPPGQPGAARPAARRIVMLAADGSNGFPFGPSAQADRDFRERNVERARSASRRGVALHLFALGGLSEKPPAFIDEMLSHGASSFSRVQSPSHESFFAERVSMPYLETLSIYDAATQEPLRDLSYTPDGRFTAWTELSPGENRLIVRAQTSDGDERESSLVVDFDATAYRERLLAEEAARMRRIQRKHLRLEVED